MRLTIKVNYFFAKHYVLHERPRTFSGECHVTLTKRSFDKRYRSAVGDGKWRGSFGAFSASC